MRRKYSLQPYGNGPDLVFEWDPETGELWGQDAEQVRRMAAEAKRAGCVTGHPYPSPYEVFDPLRRPSELAVILSILWKLPPDLIKALPPRPPDETPPGGIN
jgi:hypothetical protein